MSRTSAGAASDAYVIETRHGAAGVAVREAAGFRFFAAQPPFYAIEGQTFTGLRSLRAAVDAMAERAAGRAARKG
jgi:hypothetical protein